ncbi:conserved exported hypothetical protein [uncultured Paludibacter sp.]|nr:conserved exported hypothetical protein [uncultured Paludibacter sp.]
MQKILKYIILLNSILLCGFSTQLSAQEKKDTTKVTVPLYQGFTVELDVVPFVETAFNNGEIYGTQGNLQFNLKNKFFPVIEIGYSSANKTLQNESKTNFSGKGMYEKIGIDFNLLKQNPGGKIYNNYFLAGLRFGMTKFDYSINNLYIEDNYWGGSENLNLNLTSPTKFWYELVGGIRVDIYKGITMGWNVRNKHLMKSTANGNVAPWYIPGYGKNTTSLWGFSYIIGYRF